MLRKRRLQTSRNVPVGMRLSLCLCLAILVGLFELGIQGDASAAEERHAGPPLVQAPVAVQTACPSNADDTPGLAPADLSPPLDGTTCGPELRTLDRVTDLRDGWPIFLDAPGAGFPYTPTLYDGDNDGADEIFLTGGETFGLRGDGTFLPGWPTLEHQYMGYGTNGSKPGPSGADLTGDGVGEILWTERDWWAGSSRMWCFNGRNFDGSDLPGFPQYAPDDYSNALDTPFVLGDTDGDGDLEAWGPHTLGNNADYYRLSAFDHLGTRLFTVDLDPAESIVNLYFGDLDGDRSREMFALSWRDPSFRLHAFAPDGSELPGYPILLHTFAGGSLPFGPPVPADLDGDHDLEILLGHWDGAGSRVHGVHHDGTPCAGFPIEIATSSQLFYFGLGDVTGDRVPELIALDNHLGAGYRAHVLDIASGTSLPGWPYAVSFWPKSFPTVVDVDDDGIQEVCFVTDGGTLLAIAGDGQLLDGYPKYMAGPSISGVAAGDIDGDGFFELVAATWDGWVYAWDTVGRALPGRADWPLRGVNARNTGIFGESGYAADVAGQPTLTALPKLRLCANPAFHRVEFLVGSPRFPAAVEIFDASGRLVDRLAISRTAGRWAEWRPAPETAAGTYLARLRGSRPGCAVRFVLLR